MAVIPVFSRAHSPRPYTHGVAVKIPFRPPASGRPRALHPLHPVRPTFSPFATAVSRYPSFSTYHAIRARPETGIAVSLGQPVSDAVPAGSVAMGHWNPQRRETTLPFFCSILKRGTRTQASRTGSNQPDVVVDAASLGVAAASLPPPGLARPLSWRRSVSSFSRSRTVSIGSASPPRTGRVRPARSGVRPELIASGRERRGKGDSKRMEFHLMSHARASSPSIQGSAPVSLGRSSQTRPASNRPMAFLSRRTPSAPQAPHCLKRNATPAAKHRSRTASVHSGCIGRASGPDSLPTIT